MKLTNKDFEFYCVRVASGRDIVDYTYKGRCFLNLPDYVGDTVMYRVNNIAPIISFNAKYFEPDITGTMVLRHAYPAQGYKVSEWDY